MSHLQVFETNTEPRRNVHKSYSRGIPNQRLKVEVNVTGQLEHCVHHTGAQLNRSMYTFKKEAKAGSRVLTVSLKLAQIAVFAGRVVTNF